MKSRFARPEFLLAGAVITIAVLMRYQMLGHRTADFKVYLQPWARYIETHGGFAALGDKFADYNVPYLYILAILTYLPISLLTGIKLVSIAFDAIMAFYVFRMVALYRPGWRMPLFAALIVFCLPTVILNGAFWGQCDSIYAAFAIAGLYHLFKRQAWLGCALLGVAFAFKQQALFVFPVLFILLLLGRVPWRTVLAIPAAYLLLAVPAAIAGRPIGELLTIYVSQAGAYQSLVLNAPSFWALLPAPRSLQPELTTAGVLFTALLFMLLAYAVTATRAAVRLDPVLLAVACAIIAPLALPGMHERYFYLADVLTIAAFCLAPRRLWYLPLLMQVVSLLSYSDYLFAAESPIRAPVLALVVLGLAVAALYELFNRPTSARIDPRSQSSEGTVRAPDSPAVPPAQRAPEKTDGAQRSSPAYP